MLVLVFLMMISLEGKANHLQLEQTVEDVAIPFNEVLPASSSLSITFESLNPRINAEIIRENNHYVIKVMGGMLTHQLMNENALKMLLCHELGHLLGGPPYKARGGWSSTEGQADYYSGRYCSRLLDMDESSLYEGAINLTSIYAEVVRQPFPRLDRCEEIVAPRTNFGYPSVQCRLDTILAGWKNEARPSCWFIE